MNASTTKPWNEAPTERQNPNGIPGSCLGVFDADVGNVVRKVGRAVHRDEVHAVGRQSADALHQRLLHDVLLEDRRLARRVDRAPHARVADRTIVVVLHIVLAAPHDLDRLADRLRRLDGVDDEVGLAAAAEPAAHVGHVDFHLVRRQPRCRHGGLMRWRLPLRRHVHVAAVRTIVRRAVHRLHRRVREEGRFERALEGLRTGNRRVGVSVVARDLAGLLRELLVSRQNLGARELGERPFVPGDLERLRTARGRPVVVGDDGHAGADLHDVRHAGNGLRLVGVEPGDLAAEHRAAHHPRRQETRQLHVDAEHRGAVDLLRHVEPRERVAEHLEVLRILQRHAFRHWQRRRLVHQRAVLHAAAACLVDHLALVGRAACSRPRPTSARRP